MKKEYLIRKILLIGLLFVFFSCDKDEFTNNGSGESASESKGVINQVFYGDEVVVGNGIVNSWLILNEFGRPLEIGIEMTPQVLENLPVDADFKEQAVIPLPKYAAETTAFDHIRVIWNPESFSTIEGFNNPHFSIYFFMLPEDKRMDIPEWSEETDAKFSNYPPKNHMPFDYAPIEKGSGSFATIGRHWLSNNNKTLNDHTLTFGTYDGSFIFINPVVTLDFLKSGKTFTDTYPQGVSYPLNNLLPREYNIYTNEKGNHFISLANFINR